MRCTAVDAATVRIASMQMQCVWIATIATLAALVVAEATHTGRGPGAGRALLIAANKLVDRIRGRAALRIIHRRSRAAPAVRWAAECPWRRALRSSAASRTPRGDLPTSHVGWPSGQARHTLHRNRIKNKYVTQCRRRQRGGLQIERVAPPALAGIPGRANRTACAPSQIPRCRGGVAPPPSGPPRTQCLHYSEFDQSTARGGDRATTTAA